MTEKNEDKYVGPCVWCGVREKDHELEGCSQFAAPNTERNMIYNDKIYKALIEDQFSIRCNLLNIHRYLSYTTDPAKFICKRCAKRKDLNVSLFLQEDDDGKIEAIVDNSGTLVAKRLCRKVFVLSRPTPNIAHIVNRITTWNYEPEFQEFTYLKEYRKWYDIGRKNRYKTVHETKQFAKVTQPYRGDTGYFEITPDLKALLELAL